MIISDEPMNSAPEQKILNESVWLKGFGVV